MKKIKLIAAIILCITLSFGFRSCSDTSSVEYFWLFMGSITFGSILAGADNSSQETFGIGVGNDGVIIKSIGADTINFSYRNSGTANNLNGLRIQPTTYQPLAIAVGNNGTVTRSTNQGETWVLSSPVTSSDLYAADITAGVQYCAGDNGVIMISYDMGASWSLQTSGVTRNLKGIGTNGGGGNVVAVGEKGTILRTTNSGLNWINLSIPDTTINFYCVSQRTRLNFYATNYYLAGSLGRIYKSTDNGTTWVLKNSGTTNTLRSIFFGGNDSGAVTGDNGTVRITTNAGETWFSDPYFSNVTGSITSISLMPRSARTFTALSNNNKLFIASEDSNLVILGLKNINNTIPVDYSLEQNYPNPFNPVTTIKFSISNRSGVKLTVYDINGRLVEILVNQNLQAGEYSFDWHAENYSSGVYFYLLTAGDFTKTNKMILIK